MRYIPVTCEQREAMLRAVGVSAVDDALRRHSRSRSGLTGRPRLCPRAWREIELASPPGIARRACNAPASELVSFMGAGCYDHYIPSVVDHVLLQARVLHCLHALPARGQPGHAAGDLRVPVDDLRADRHGCVERVDVRRRDRAGRSGIHGGRVTKRDRSCACPRFTLSGRTRLPRTPRRAFSVRALDVRVRSATDGLRRIDGAGGLGSLLAGGDVAAVLVRAPNFFGNLRGPRRRSAVSRTTPARCSSWPPTRSCSASWSRRAHTAPTSWSAKDSRLATRMSYGGPGLGFFTCRQAARPPDARPRRRSYDRRRRRHGVRAHAFHARAAHPPREGDEQHLQQPRAQRAWPPARISRQWGEQGLAGIARACVAKAHYLREKLLATGRFKAPWETPFGYEFALAYEGDVRRDAGRSARRGLPRRSERRRRRGRVAHRHATSRWPRISCCSPSPRSARATKSTHSPRRWRPCDRETRPHSGAGSRARPSCRSIFEVGRT